jgi:hypothetical protein
MSIIRPGNMLLFDSPELGRCVFSDDLKFRYLLTRRWAKDGWTVTWIMLNPSTADEVELDPTLRRCADFSNRWGASGMEVVNLFALRSPDPKDLKRFGLMRAIGQDNNRHIRESYERSTVTIAGWGVHGSLINRDSHVIRILEHQHTVHCANRYQAGARVCECPRIFCLGTTKGGQPKHPLYLPKNTKRERWP